MGIRFYKSVKLGKYARVNFSKSGIGYSVGAGGVRYTHSARRSRKTERTSILGLILKWLFLFYKWMFIIALFPITVPIMVIRRKKRKKETAT